MILLVAGVVVVLDRVSKIYIVGALDPGDSVTLIRGILDLTYVRNPGAIFGLFESLNSFLIPIGLLVILAILYYSFRIRPRDRLLDLVLALELGGATGNLIDRVSYGKVIDFIDFKVWPVFNLADSAISLGLFFLGLYLLSQIKSAREVG